MAAETSEYPGRGFEIVLPPIAVQQLTGWLGTAQFSRRGHQYSVKFVAYGLPQCERDGKPIAWVEMSAETRAVARKAADWLKAAKVA